jgi:predicted acylesterase/phospholipase RssA/CRP-like cAMP-binding protein
MIQPINCVNPHCIALNGKSAFTSMPQTKLNGTAQQQKAQLPVADSLSAQLKQAGLRPGYVTLRQEDWLFRQGDAGDAVYFVEKGAIQLILTTGTGRPQVIDVAPAETAVGVVAAFSGQWRGVSARALTDTALVRLDRTELPKLAQNHPTLYIQLQEQLCYQRQLREKCRLLGRYWGNFDPALLHNFLAELAWVQLPAGETLFAQGASQEYVAFVVNGRLQQSQKQLNGQRTDLSQIGSNKFAGQLPQVDNPRHRSTVIAQRDSEVIVMSQNTLQRLGQKAPEAWAKLSDDFIIRKPVEQSITAVNNCYNLAFIPLANTVPLPSLIAQLQESAFPPKDSLLLTKQSLDASLLASDSLLPWLDKQEQFHDYLLYQADPVWTAWTQRCVRQADQIVLVADATQPASLTDIEEQIERLKPGVKPVLVLVHPPETMPTGTAVWLQNRQLMAHYHLRHGNRQEIARLGRHLSGQAVGLVLSAGGARGYAHIGAYKALLEAGSEIDYLGGTSMGGLIAAIFAAGHSYDKTVAFARQYGSANALLDYTLPSTSLCSSDKINKMLTDLFQNIQIEDLLLPFFCISTDLSQSQPVVHQRGSLRRAVRASIAIPGVFAPVSINGNLHVDGSVMNSLPIDVMRQLMPQGKIVAVNATPVRNKSRTWEIDDAISGWEMLGNRLNPFSKRKRVPSLVSTLLQALYVNSGHKLEDVKPLADQFIQLDTKGHGMMAWNEHEALIDTGYQSARRQLRQVTHVDEPSSYSVGESLGVWHFRRQISRT